MSLAGKLIAFVGKRAARRFEAACREPGVPEGFQPPPLNWFRGLRLAARLDPREVSVHAEMDMQMAPAQASTP